MNVHKSGFLSGGGEMSERIRTLDWSTTSLGPIATWPQSLRTTLGIILHSKFPMFLFWGKELLCFYNDAYRPSLGQEGKHPEALGKRGDQVWPEIWPYIKPLIEEVLAGGEATWSEDQLLPIYRNGKLEDVYWTFSYSPVHDENDQMAGVFVTCSETTKQVEVLGKLQISEKRFQGLIAQASVGMIVLRGEEMIVDIVNEGYGRLIDRTPEALLGNPLFEIIPETKPDFLPILEKVRLSGEALYLYDHPYFVIVAGKKKEGYLDLVYQPYRQQDGSISGVMVLCQDVTEKVKARIKVEESEQRVRSLIESAPFPIGVYVGKEMYIEFANQAILDVWGKGNAVIGKRYAQVLPELDNQHIFSQLDGVFTTGIPFHAKGERVDLVVEGKLQPFYFNYSFTPLFDGQGKVYGVMNTAANVTDLSIAKQKVEEGTRRLQLLTESIPQIVWSATADGNLDYFSLQWREYSGMSVEESLGQGWAKTIHPDDLPALSAQWSHSLSTGHPYGVEARVRRLDGTYRWMLIRALPLLSEQGKILQWMGTCTDMQERKETEENLQAMTEELAASNEELAAANEEILVTNEELAAANTHLTRTNVDLDNFIYTASHDLKAPISNIESLLAALLRSLSPQSLSSERVQHITSLMGDSVERFKRTIASLTEVVKLQKENSAEIESVDLVQVVEDVRLDLEPLIQATSAQLNIAVSSCPTVRFSAKNLRSVVYNLLSNAIKYRFPNRVPHISISCKHTLGYQVLSISDNGLGIEPKRMSQLFTMFKRFHDHVEGTGIGLYMVKKMVENGGGRIEVESEVGKGSTFHVFFPF